MHLEVFWKLSDAFFEASKKSVLNLKISGIFYLRAVLRHGEASKPPKTVLHAQSALKLFWGVSSTQNEPETYLQHHHTTKIEASKVLSKFEKIHLIFWHSATQIWHSAFARQCTSRNGSRITSMGPQTLLRVCRVFFRVQGIDWDASRSFLKTFRCLFWGI